VPYHHNQPILENSVNDTRAKSCWYDAVLNGVFHPSQHNIK
jgi:hypothetical protein